VACRESAPWPWGQGLRPDRPAIPGFPPGGPYPRRSIDSARHADLPGRHGATAGSPSRDSRPEGRIAERPSIASAWRTIRGARAASAAGGRPRGLPARRPALPTTALVLRARPPGSLLPGGEHFRPPRGPGARRLGSLLPGGQHFRPPRGPGARRLGSLLPGGQHFRLSRRSTNQDPPPGPASVDSQATPGRRGAARRTRRQRPDEAPGPRPPAAPLSGPSRTPWPSACPRARRR
jgi:hypothetical protein